MTTNHGNWPSSCLVQFKNCTILRDHKLIQEDLWIRNCLIVNPEPIFYEERVTADIQVDCKGAIISPGYIDLQINGGMGVDFSHNVDIIGEAVAKVAKGVLPFGVTSICPTIVTSTPDVYHKALSKVQKCDGSANGAGILGLHLEGPFINKHKKGAHKAQLIQSLDDGLEAVARMYGPLDNVAIVTVAPELDVDDTVIPSLVKRGITVSIGHSEANLVQGEKAIQRGASFITHLFNAMLPFHHRDPGLVGLLTSKKLPEEKHIFYGIIADGIHTHPAALRIAYKTNARGESDVGDGRNVGDGTRGRSALHRREQGGDSRKAGGHCRYQHALRKGQPRCHCPELGKSRRSNVGDGRDVSDGTRGRRALHWREQGGDSRKAGSHCRYQHALRKHRNDGLLRPVPTEIYRLQYRGGARISVPASCGGPRHRGSEGNAQLWSGGGLCDARQRPSRDLHVDCGEVRLGEVTQRVHVRTKKVTRVWTCGHCTTRCGLLVCVIYLGFAIFIAMKALFYNFCN
ncbi:N-acetyl-glucosamine-6-phosphate deacetylase, putative [Ixodes scapularis]|uniref:N-acetylglucosamine-6-phosphate deacetylase n=1 Tax=Ixodes scapularis TaxID=6945 RepID=B7PE06_IXOSC|nr:N-acetyl-glucosamine-6-phosphate deacetylase, putative [Ixodes scapularis]|eukprot:XP_002399584.1 N-acetyl-glucosamine-6-phosphate deacetylase, putative [Ixodes scapularis]